MLSWRGYLQNPLTLPMRSAKIYVQNTLAWFGFPGLDLSRVWWGQIKRETLIEGQSDAARSQLKRFPEETQAPSSGPFPYNFRFSLGTTKIAWLSPLLVFNIKQEVDDGIPVHAALPPGGAQRGGGISTLPSKHL